MNTLDCIFSRRSCKDFLPVPVEKESCVKIAEAGSRAANGRGWQSPVIFAVSDPAFRARISRMNGAILGTPEDFDPFYGAPLIYIVLAESARPTAVYDGSLVLGNMMLAAHELGLGSCWIHRAREMYETPEGRQLLREMGLPDPENYIGVGHLATGTPNPAHAPRPDVPRKPDYIRYI